MSIGLVCALAASVAFLALVALLVVGLVRELFRPPWWDQTAQREKAWRTFQRNWERGRL